MGLLLYSEDHLYRLRRTKDQVLNLEEHSVLFCPILKKVVVLEELLFINTLWYLSLRYDCSSALVLPLNPQNSYLDKSISWFTLSNAFSKSQNIPPTVNLLLSASNISFISLMEAFSVEELFLKPYCLVPNILLWLMCWYNLVYITFSRIFEKGVSKE